MTSRMKEGKRTRIRQLQRCLHQRLADQGVVGAEEEEEEQQLQAQGQQEAEMVSIKFSET